MFSTTRGECLQGTALIHKLHTLDPTGSQSRTVFSLTHGLVLKVILYESMSQSDSGASLMIAQTEAQTEVLRLKYSD